MDALSLSKIAYKNVGKTVRQSFTVDTWFKITDCTVTEPKVTETEIRHALKEFIDGVRVKEVVKASERRVR